jgi:hypothetical protein
MLTAHVYGMLRLIVGWYPQETGYMFQNITV